MGGVEQGVKGGVRRGGGGVGVQDAGYAIPIGVLQLVMPKASLFVAVSVP